MIDYPYRILMPLPIAWAAVSLVVAIAFAITGNWLPAIFFLILGAFCG